jgi:hypothetical protein
LAAPDFEAWLEVPSSHMLIYTVSSITSSTTGQQLQSI